MSKRAFIFAAGKYSSEDVKLYKRIKYKAEDLILCADGGYDTLYYTSIVPNVVIGDFDSIRTPIPKDITRIKYPADKDKTDLEICIDYAIEKGCDTVFLLGALGGRTDHSLCAVYALKYAMDNGAEAMILNAKTRMYLVRDEVELHRENFDYISLLPCTDTVGGVTTSGLKYKLENATLRQGSSFGISNEFFNNTAKISIKSGLLFVICTTA